MKKKLILPLFVLFLLSHLSLIAQSSTTLLCEMTIEQISLEQSYDQDHPKQEETMRIATSLKEELIIVYNMVNQNITGTREEHIKSIEELILSAENLGMNYSMFDADLEFIETINKK